MHIRIRNVICNCNFTVLKFKINSQLKLISKECSTLVKLEDLQSRYSDVDQELILTTLNTATPEHLSQLSVSQTRIKTLKNWQSERGPFKSLADLLKVQGFCLKTLDRICASIVARRPQDEVSHVPSKGRRQFVIPPLKLQ
uniref:Uncharacterized protein n=1 Tax=Photinus pyralis TaxID=7054 RepID=A0A1Y1KBV7_PHOPY